MSARVRGSESAREPRARDTPALSHLRTLALLLLLGGCAHGGAPLVRPEPASLPAGSPLLSREVGDEHAWVRHHLMLGEFERALDVLRDSPVAPSDRLVRALQEGVVLHHSRDFERSNEALEWAEREADRRFTRSVSRAAGSLLASDRVLAYSPSAAELAMIPYYRMLNYLAMGDVQGAVVESRKANALLARLEREPGDRCQEDGLLLYLAGLVQRAGGERADALVSLRQAERSLGACEIPAPAAAVASDLVREARALGLGEVADSVARRHALEEPPVAEGAGDLVLLVEHGFVTHRAERALHVPIFAEEIEGLEGDDEEEVAAAAARISERMLHNLWEQAAWGRSWDDERHVQWASALSGAYVLRLAWPVARREASRPAAVRVWVGDSLASVVPAGDLSAVVQREMEEQRPAVLARLVARGLAKFLVSREVEREAEDRGGELAGFLVGRLSNLAANELERADTRSWSLLPDRISLVRARLPEGTYPVRVESLGADGQVLASRELAPVVIRKGALELRSERVWGSERGEAGNRYPGSSTR
jgi:hypothetical protein